MTNQPTVPARLVWSIVALAALLVLGGVPAADAADPMPAEELTRLLVEGKGPADWSGVLEGQLLAEARAVQATRYGDVVGPIFTDDTHTAGLEPEARRKLYAFVIDHLIEAQPEDDVILLVDVFLPHLGADPALVQRLREGDLLSKDLRTGRRPAWDRLQRNVARLLSATDPVVRRAAIRLLPERETGEAADAVALLHGAVVAAGGTLERDDAEAYFDAFEALLYHRFATVGALTSFLDPFKDRLADHEKWSDLERVEVERDLLRAIQRLTKSAGSKGTERWLQAARKFGGLQIANAQGPADLGVFFDPDIEGDPVLQREAAQKAASLKPGPDEAWTEFLRRCLAHSTDEEVLGRVIAILGATFKKPAPPHTPLVATAVARRLKDGVNTDSVEHRVNLAQTLGVIGSLTDLQEALPDPQRMLNGNGTARQARVWAALIHAMGLVETGLVVRLALYYSLGDKLQPEWARLAVAKALGLDGIRNSKTEKAQAAAMLRHILQGDEITLGDQKLEARNSESVPAVRIAAIRSTQHYPDLGGIAAVLGKIAAEPAEEGAEAVKFLGRQLGKGSVEAGAALAGLIQSEADPTRLDALLDLVTKQTPAEYDAAARGGLAEAVLSVMQREDAGQAQRLKAVQASVRLADHLALGAVYEAWGAQPEEADRAAWMKGLQALFVAVAPAGAEDAAVEQALLGALSAMRDKRHYAEALACLDAMGEHADRRELKRLRADLHYEFASAGEDRTPKERRADLDAAQRLYREVAEQTSDEDSKRDILISAFEALKLRALKDYLDVAGGEKAKTFLLKALEVAVQTKDRATAKEASESIVRVLEEADAGLTDDEKKILEQYKNALKLIEQK